MLEAVFIVVLTLNLFVVSTKKFRRSPSVAIKFSMKIKT